MIGELSLFRPVLEAPPFRDVEARVRRGSDRIALSGLVEGSRAVVLAILGLRLRRRLLIVVPDDASLAAWQRDLTAVADLIGRDPGGIVVLPAMDSDPYDAIAPHPEVTRERVVALGRIARREADVVLTPVRAMLSWLPSPEEWRSRSRTVRGGDELPPDRFILDAIRHGYRRVDTVSGAGEISRRGGIVDIFPPDAEEPVRIELFGDTVDSLRSFDTDHQRSTGTLREVHVGPAVENPPSDDGIARLSRWLERGSARAADDPAAARQFRRQLDTLQSEGYLPGLEALAAIMSSRKVTLFEHTRDFLRVLDEPVLADEEVVRVSHERRNSWQQSGDRVLPPPDRLFVDPAVLRDELRQVTLTLQELGGDEPEGVDAAIPFTTRTARSYQGRMQDLARDIQEESEAGARVVCAMRTRGVADRLAEILDGYGIDARTDTPAPGVVAGPVLRVAGLRAGFEFPEQRLIVLAEREIFGERKKKERRPRSRAAFVSDFRDLRPDDPVVHVDHGIARYAGLGRPKGGSLNRDFMVLEFAGGDRLFVPVDRLDLVQKYGGVGEAKPKLDRLGGPGWNRVKARVRKSIRSMAKELLELYARRRSIRGHAFPDDSPWQSELEDAFAYETTPDQDRAVAEIKSDMQAPRPMDRLLVGDVGFGKTEVAVRAAFKAVLDGRQVAILAPTTVLAYQHFETFRERFAPFPVHVEMVSRFRSAGETREILAKVASGVVDVLIGTHRLLSGDVRFRSLGLLVVDEEQRFGVAHKERLQKLSVGIDVLSMTATPIPRTLQMSMGGVRDLSLIETPPPGRTAIQTYLVPWRKNVLAQAIRQELRRGGQSFVVHNRIATLPALARAIRDMVPDARIVMAHGQLRERQLESVMLRFVRYEADVLVTTTIIENGLDIPRANTIIVNRADRFGLAQLYQLRGRVGRSEQHAYAYFVIPGRRVLSDQARRRLRALQEFSELGAGFRLAAADLEIRGAGELLGSRQHGHIAALGFDLYCQLLERTVAEMQGEPIPERSPVSLHLGVDIKVPEAYMPEAGQRLALYKRLAGCRDDGEVDRLVAESEDRYGQLPPQGRNVFALTRLRIVAESLGVTGVDVADGKLRVRFGEEAGVDPGRLVEVVGRVGGTLSPKGMLTVPAPERASDRIEATRRLLTTLLTTGDARA
jgi:transcription-repair coupling factor (superfamily II helicase)